MEIRGSIGSAGRSWTDITRADTSDSIALEAPTGMRGPDSTKSIGSDSLGRDSHEAFHAGVSERLEHINISKASDNGKKVVGQGCCASCARAAWYDRLLRADRKDGNNTKTGCDLTPFAPPVLPEEIVRPELSVVGETPTMPHHFQVLHLGCQGCHTICLALPCSQTHVQADALSWSELCMAAPITRTSANMCTTKNRKKKEKMRFAGGMGGYSSLRD